MAFAMTRSAFVVLLVLMAGCAKPQEPTPPFPADSVAEGNAQWATAFAWEESAEFEALAIGALVHAGQGNCTVDLRVDGRVVDGPAVVEYVAVNGTTYTWGSFAIGLAGVQVGQASTHEALKVVPWQATTTSPDGTYWFEVHINTTSQYPLQGRDFTVALLARDVHRASASAECMGGATAAGIASRQMSIFDQRGWDSTDYMVFYDTGSMVKGAQATRVFDGPVDVIAGPNTQLSGRMATGELNIAGPEGASWDLREGETFLWQGRPPGQYKLTLDRTFMADPSPPFYDFFFVGAVSWQEVDSEADFEDLPIFEPTGPLAT